MRTTPSFRETPKSPGLLLTWENASLDNLRICTHIALGEACKLLREFGLTARELWTKHPELWCPIIPAEPFRRFLISGGQL